MEFLLPSPTVSVTTTDVCSSRVHFIRLNGTHFLRQHRWWLWQQVFVQYFRIHFGSTKKTVAAIRSRRGASGQRQRELINRQIKVDKNPAQLVTSPLSPVPHY